MPEKDDITIQPSEDGSTDNLAETETTETPKKKLEVPGVGEKTAEEIAEAFRAKENEAKWRREMNEKGIELNEIKRKLAEDRAEIERKFSTFEERIKDSQTTPTRDWRTVDDPDERERLRELERIKEKNETNKRIRELEEKLTAAEVAKKNKDTYDYWNDIYEDAIIDHGFEDKNSNELLRSVVQKKLTDLGMANWTPNKIKDTVKQCREVLVERDKSAAERYANIKKKGLKIKPPSSGNQPAPQAAGKFKAGMSALERRRLMAQDPNLQD